MNEDNYEGKIPRFSGTSDEDFCLRSLRVEASLESRALAAAQENDDVDDKLDKQARKMIIAASGDDPLRTIQDCRSAKQAWNKLQTRYASKSTINELRVLNNLLNPKLSNLLNMEDHISLLDLHPCSPVYRNQ